jgi:hypothetical protein
MKDAFVMLVALGFGAGFSYMICYSAVSYYTTWALGVHVVYFIAFVINSIWFGDNSTITRWGFAPGFCIAVSVAAAVVYIVTSQWDDLFDEYCSDSDECYDLMLEFMITHYTPRSRTCSCTYSTERSSTPARASRCCTGRITGCCCPNQH